MRKEHVAQMVELVGVVESLEGFCQGLTITRTYIDGEYRHSVQVDAEHPFAAEIIEKGERSEWYGQVQDQRNVTLEINGVRVYTFETR